MNVNIIFNDSSSEINKIVHIYSYTGLFQLKVHTHISDLQMRELYHFYFILFHLSEIHIIIINILKIFKMLDLNYKI